MTSYSEDEKAANEYANEPNSIDEFTLGEKLLMRAAFLAGCNHVRTSAEQRALEGVTMAAIAVESIYWDFEKSMKKEVVNLKAALDELDRLRGDK